MEKTNLFREQESGELKVHINKKYQCIYFLNIFSRYSVSHVLGCREWCMGGRQGDGVCRRSPTPSLFVWLRFIDLAEWRPTVGYEDVSLQVRVMEQVRDTCAVVVHLKFLIAIVTAIEYSPSVVWTIGVGRSFPGLFLI